MLDPCCNRRLAEAMVGDADAVVDYRDNDGAWRELGFLRGGGFWNFVRFALDVFEISLKREPGVGDLQDSGLDETTKCIKGLWRDEYVGTQHLVHQVTVG